MAQEQLSATLCRKVMGRSLFTYKHQTLA
jgi:hypothetical protein